MSTNIFLFVLGSKNNILLHKHAIHVLANVNRAIYIVHKYYVIYK